MTIPTRLLLALAAAALLMLAPAPARGASGQLDEGFSGDGRGLTDLQAGSDDEALAAIVDDHSRLLLAGYSFRTPEGIRLALARYLPDGRLDPTFGVGGVVINTLGGGMIANDVAIDAVGRIVVAGRDGNHTAKVARLLPNGRLDPSFGDRGLVRVPFEFVVRAVNIDLQGRVLVAGGARIPIADLNFGVFRLLENGALDPSLSGDGLAVYNLAGFGGLHPDLGEGGPDAAGEVLVDRFGRIVLAGGAWLPEPGLDRNVGRFAIARLHSNGALDPSFRGNGVALIEMNRRGSFATAAVIDGPGNTIMAGRAAPKAGFAKVRGAGLLGKRFGDGGRARLDVQGSQWPVDLSIDQLGRPVAAIGAPSLGSSAAGKLVGARLLRNGDPDFGFSNDSRVNTGFGRWTAAASPWSASASARAPATATSSRRATCRSASAQIRGAALPIRLVHEPPGPGCRPRCAMLLRYGRDPVRAPLPRTGPIYRGPDLFILASQPV